MKKLHAAGLFCLFLITTAAFAQTPKGRVLIAIRPENAIVRLDEQRFIQQTTHIQLDTGQHVLRAWAPGRQLIVDTLRVKENGAILFRKKLPPTPEYSSYRLQRFTYRAQKSSVFIMGGITIASAAYIGIKYSSLSKQIDNSKAKAEEYKSQYESYSDPQNIADYREAFEREQKNYNDKVDEANRLSTTGVLVVSAEAVATGVLYFLTRSITKPVFQETPMLSDLSVGYNFSKTDQGPRIQYNLKF